MDRIDIHEDLCAELHKLYVAKNSDYGDSFAKVREEIPNAILVRLSDKLNRLKSLMTKDDNDRKVRDESIDDTLLDIANYALLELVERRNEGDYYDDEEEEEDFETYLRKVPFSEKMRRIKEIIADISENEEDEEEESTHRFLTISDAVKEIQKTVRKAYRNSWINKEGLHDEIFTEFIPILNKLKVVHYVVKDGEVIDYDVNYYDEDDDINLNVSGWKEHKENKHVDDSED